MCSHENAFHVFVLSEFENTVGGISLENDRLRLNSGGIFLHEALQLHLATFVQRGGELREVNLIPSIFSKWIFPKLDNMQGNNLGVVVSGQRLRVLIRRNRELRKIN